MPTNPLHELIGLLSQLIPAFWQCHRASTPERKDRTLRAWLELTDPFWKAHRIPVEAIRGLTDPTLAWCRQHGCAGEEHVSTIERAVSLITGLAMVTIPRGIPSIDAKEDQAQAVWEGQGQLMMEALKSQDALRRLAALTGDEWKGEPRLPWDSTLENPAPAPPLTPEGQQKADRCSPQSPLLAPDVSSADTARLPCPVVVAAAGDKTAATQPTLGGPFLVDMKNGRQMEFNPSGSGVVHHGCILNTAHEAPGFINPPQLAIEYVVYEVPGGSYVALSWDGARSARVFRGKEVSREEAAAEFMKDGLAVPPGLLPPSGEGLIPVTLGDDSVLQHDDVTAMPGGGSRPAGWATVVDPQSAGKAEAKPTPDDEQRQPATIVSLGDRVYMFGSRRQQVSESEDNVLQAFLGDANRPAVPRLPEPDLRARSGLNEPAKVLRLLKDKYDGLFGPALDPPHKKGVGWGVRITRATA
jgi:hypothetical protein